MLEHSAHKVIREEVHLVKKDTTALVAQLSINSHVLPEHMELIKLVKEI